MVNDFALCAQPPSPDRRLKVESPTAVNPKLQEKLRTLSNRAGCYIYRNAQDEVIYVGKAISLRSRVRSYFQKRANLTPRLRKLVNEIVDVETMLTDSEIEALILECNLIKKHRPKYNVRLRDDKSYPYLMLTTAERFPRLLYTRRVRSNDGNQYFGPYTNAFSVHQTSSLLHKIFPLIPCGKSWAGTPDQRPCLYHYMGQCLAPCAGLADRRRYQEVLGEVSLFLRGRQERLIQDLEQKMKVAADGLDFERAAKTRDQIKALQDVLQRQKVISNEVTDQDVISIVKDERGACVQMFYVRGGKLLGQRHFFLDGAADDSANEAIGEFVKQYYNDAAEIPNEILLPVHLEEMSIVEAWLRQKRGDTVNIIVPHRGEKLDLLEMAASNAEETLRQMREQLEAKTEWADHAISALAEAIDLETTPLRIEGYDISNLQGRMPVGSMVVAEAGQPAKAEYRRFKIKWHPETPDDFAMMREVITRRLRAAQNGDPKFTALPDLMLIDGGRGQLNAALQAMDEVGIKIAAIGLAKRMELLILPGKEDPVVLSTSSPALHLLQRLRDEAHRFALSYHRKLRESSALAGNPLDEIPGIGPRRKRMLLRTFGTIARLRSATATEIASVPGMTMRLAEQVKEYLAP